MRDSMDIKGLVFDIQKFCLHDGPGIRTTVFLKGCNLQCKWCHNPESISFKKQLSFNYSKCVLCGECVKVCPNNVHEIRDEKHVVHYEKCKNCGLCIENCVFDALKTIGREVTVNEVIYEVEKDKKYYQESGGGMTLSGGEATMQFEFSFELLKEAKKREIHTCLETNGVLKEENLIKLSQYVDMFLLDFKLADDELHKKFVGGSNAQVYSSIKLLAALGASVILRCPIIPGVNDNHEHFKEIARLSKEYKCIQYMEVMPYHSIGRDKWKHIGQEYSFRELDSVSKELSESWREIIKSYGGNIK
jgi:glycyl-radical enzyme activating protein